MFVISAFWRKSRKAERPGTLVLQLRDENRQVALMALGMESSKEDIMTVNKAVIEEAMNLVYLIAERWTLENRNFTINDVAAEFNS